MPESLYPLMFQPRFKERIWGGRSLETLYGKRLPPEVLIGESWEVADRPGDESVVANGPLAGRTLRTLIDEHGPDILGAAAALEDGRFPLLCKILDARERLSLQVHPPVHASHLGDPKTEMWYIAAAEPGAELFVGLKAGVTRKAFEEAVAHGTVAECFHRIAVAAGDAMFLPSGRVHAIGAGLVIFEIQQNSDTTFRVHDWNRVGLDGKPRELHVEESLASIDFEDVEPRLIAHDAEANAGASMRPLVRHSLFDIDLVRAEHEVTLAWPAPARARVVACVHGRLLAQGGGLSQEITAGEFCLLPAAAPDLSLTGDSGSAFLIVEPGSQMERPT